MGVGINLMSSPSVNFVIEAINKVRPENSSYQKAIKRVQKMIEFKELRSGKDMAYFVRRAIKFGEWGGFSSSHLINQSTIKNSFVTVYDYDIKVVALLVLGTIGFYVKQVL